MIKEGTSQDKLIKEGLVDNYDSTELLWDEIREKKLFLSGATGFFGIWLIKSFIYANDKLNLNSQASILTRNPNIFEKQFPSISSNPSIKLYKGDIRDFKFLDDDFSHIIHGATTSATETYNKQDPLTKMDTVVNGTRHTLDFAVHCGCKKFLLLSSGSVYGKQPEGLNNLEEKYMGAPYTTDKNFDNSVLGESKRLSELLTTIYSEKFNINTKVARCFSFVGPYLPLNIHYAIGNFIRDAINGKTINVSGDGSPIRSYMYITDLITWVWTILLKSKDCEIYNVGSEREISIENLAKLISQSTEKKVDVKIKKARKINTKIDRYIPSTKKAQKELNLEQKVDLEQAINKTILHIKKNKSLYNI